MGESQQHAERPEPPADQEWSTILEYIDALEAWGESLLGELDAARKLHREEQRRSAERLKAALGELDATELRLVERCARLRRELDAARDEANLANIRGEDFRQELEAARETVARLQRECDARHAEQEYLAGRLATLTEDLAAALDAGQGLAEQVATLKKAARRFDDHVELNGGCHRGCPEHDALREALCGVGGRT